MVMSAGEEHAVPKSDDAWKDQVKAEDAQRDAGKASPSAEQLPPPSISSLFQLLAAQALTAIGAIPGPSGKAEQNLPIARHFIELLGVLEKKTAGNLEEGEKKMLDDVLHDLRMGYVAMTKKS
jgi:hypothetical protein